MNLGINGLDTDNLGVGVVTVGYYLSPAIVFRRDIFDSSDGGGG